MTSPIGAVYVALLDAINDWDDFLDQLPPVGASIAIMLVQTAIFLYATYYVDVQAIAKMDAVEDPAFDARVLENLDSDVQDERDRTAARAAGDDPLRVDRLRKVFQPKVQGRKAVTAVQDISFTVKSGEIFGLLGLVFIQPFE